MQPDQQPALRVDDPCPMSWMNLEGGQRKKFCGACQLHVHNAEEMTRQEAHALVRDSDERVCMRIVTDPAGNPVFKSEAAPQAGAQPNRLRAAGLALAAGGWLAACQPSAQLSSASDEPQIAETHTSSSDAIPTDVVMGTVAPTDTPLEILGEVVLPDIEPAFGPGILIEDPETPELDPNQHLLDDLQAHIKPQGAVMLGRVTVAPPHGIELPPKPPSDLKPKR